MANVRTLKKDINFVLGDIIEAVYIWELSTAGKPTDESQAIIDEAIKQFDTLIERVNDKKAENKKAHFKAIYTDLEGTANQLVEKINAL